MRGITEEISVVVLSALLLAGGFSLYIHYIEEVIVENEKIDQINQIDQGKSLTKSYEGFRTRMYLDSKGYLTGGYGSRLYESKEYPKKIWELIYDWDYHVAEQDYEKLELTLDPIRKLVIIDMIFNMGLSGVQGFHNMLFALRFENYKSASLHLLDSKYALDVPVRAIRNSNILETGRMM